MKSLKVWQVALKLDEQSFLLIPGHCVVNLPDRTTHSWIIIIGHNLTLHFPPTYFMQVIIPTKLESEINCK